MLGYIAQTLGQAHVRPHTISPSHLPQAPPGPPPGLTAGPHSFAPSPAFHCHFSPSFSELASEFLRAKARSDRSPRYIRQMRLVFASFARKHAQTPCNQLTPQHIEAWTRGQGWRARTIRGNVVSLRILFHWGVRRGLLATNPCASVELPSAAHERPVEIHTPAEVRAVLEAARAESLDVLRHLVIRYFCGVRSAEAHRLDESAILLDSGWVCVAASKAKTRARRLVAIRPNLRAWLALGGELRPLSPNTVQRVVRASGVRWPHNVTRNSFVSYAAAQPGAGAGAVAIEAGHSEAILFRHYRALATPNQAAEFWSIRP